MRTWYNKHMKTLQHNKEQFVEALLAWYDENARILPWRSLPTPYRVWVSEIMLQQTRVEAVKPYFERFMQAFPTLSSLAEAKDDELVKVWEGLGYYRRVSNMKKCAQQCMEHFHGELPSTYKELLTLAGIGSYTAGAIASIAFRQPVAAVDGNVLRVFSRILISKDDISKEATKKKFHELINEYIPKDRPDAFNQALMEIGAMICVPNSAPRCNICPLAAHCLGYQSGEAHALPIKSGKKKRRIEEKTVVVMVCEDQCYLQKRPEQGLLANLYEFYMFHQFLSKAEVEKHFQEQYEIVQTLSLLDAKHIFSHVEWHMKGFLIEIKPKDQLTGLWVKKQELKDTYALPSAYKVYKEALDIYWRR
ncbi:MAG: A/G-specific adenine glycosylase [Erysipelotrichaceae bacterium]|nr:A/G-specific adenine glycosylase [Erysipelotrichaceae bacterium]